MKEKSKIKLRLINKSDYRFLYKNLKERDHIENISHRKIPTYNEHIRFVSSKPYLKWYVIEQGKRKIGSAYLTKDNEIAMHFCKGITERKIYQEIFELITEKNPRHRYYVNVNPKNSKMINFYKKNGFTLRQVTYAVDYYFID